MNVRQTRPDFLTSQEPQVRRCPIWYILYLFYFHVIYCYYWRYSDVPRAKVRPPLELVTWQVSLSREREYAAQYLSYIEPSLHDGLSPISREEEGTAAITKPSPAVVFDIII